MTAKFFILTSLFFLSFDGAKALTCQSGDLKGKCFDPTIETCDAPFSLPGNFCPEIQAGVEPEIVILILRWVVVSLRLVRMGNVSLFLRYNVILKLRNLILCIGRKYNKPAS